MEKSFSSKKTETEEIYWPEKDKWFIIKSTPVLDAQNEIKYFIDLMLDVTEQKKSKILLEKQNQLLKEALELAEINKKKYIKAIIELDKAQEVAKVGSWKWKIAENVLECSNEIYRVFGIPKNQTHENEIENLFANVHPDDYAKVEEATKSILENLSPVPLEYRIVTPKGEIKTIWSETGEILVDKNNKVIQISGIAKDITEQKHLEKEKFKLTNILEISTNEIYLFDGQYFLFEYLNQGALQNSGYTAAEIRLMHPWDIKPLISEEKFKEMVAPLLSKQQKRIVFETVHQRKNGSVYPVEIHLQAYFEDHKCTFFALINDITDRKNYERELIRAKEIAELNETQLLEAQQIAHIGSWHWDLKSDLLTWSKEEYRIFEQDFNTKLTNTQFLNLVYPDDRDFVINAHRKLIEGNGYELNFRILVNGTMKWLYEKARVNKDKNNNPVYVTGITHDISKIKEQEDILIRKNQEYAALNEEYKTANERLLSAKEKAEESDKLKTEFINNMSHEIRTPLNSILGFSKMLSNAELPPQKSANFIHIIQNSGQQLLNIIDDILDISMLETMQAENNDTEFSLNDLFLDIFSRNDMLAKSKKIAFYVKKEFADKDCMLLCDKDKLFKVLHKLTDNAIKFTHEGSVELGYYQSTDNLLHNEITIYVKDTGIGIHRKNFELIFESFSQEETGLSKNSGGLGLGLAIAQKTAQLLGTSIQLSSEKGKGSNFYFTLPLIAAQENQTYIRPPQKQRALQTILIAEDEEVNYLFLETLLMDDFELDCRIIHAKNGKEAVELCQQNHDISLILMDIKMPVMNGIEATKIIKEQYPQIPIIAQTAYSTDDDKHKILLSGCDEFISKPIQENALRVLMEKFLKLN